MDQVYSHVLIASWKQTINRLDKLFAPLDEKQLHTEVATDKNRLLYLLGHLTAVHDRMLPLLGVGDRLHPELDTYVSHPDRTFSDPLSTTQLKKAWEEVNAAVTSGIEGLTPDGWLQKHTAVSDVDFSKDPTRNRFAVVLSRINHASYHLGQAVLAK